MTNEEKLVELETRYSFQEDLLQQLNEIVTKQDARIDLLEQQLHLMAERVKELQSQVPASDGAADQEIPPHY